MKISELIAQLEKLKEENGDSPVFRHSESARMFYTIKNKHVYYSQADGDLHRESGVYIE